MGPVLAIARKDLLLLLRDKGGLFFVFFFPILFALFFGTIFSGDGKATRIEVMVADEDGTDGSRAFVEALRKSEDVRVAPAATREEAVGAVRAGKAPAAIVIPKGFGDRDQSMFGGDPPKVELAVDPSRKAEGGMLEGILLQQAGERMGRKFTDPAGLRRQAKAGVERVRSGDVPPDIRRDLEPLLDRVSALADTYDRRAAEGADGGASDSAVAGFFRPLAIERIPSVAAEGAGDRPSNGFAVTFPQAAIWGVIGATAGFGISLVSERTKGTMVRLRAAPIPRSAVLLGKAIACFTTVVGVVAVLLVIASAGYGVRVQSPALLALAVASIGVCFVGIMMLLASAARTEQAAGGMGWAVLIVMSMVGGGMIPLMFMPAWMSSLGSVSPVKWAILAMEGAVWRGYTPAQMLLPCGVLTAIGVVGFAVGARVFRSAG